ncbi:MAG: hypothetical protein DSZ33_00895, partial [Gammaproteobacteria bacterium]
ADPFLVGRLFGIAWAELYVKIRVNHWPTRTVRFGVGMLFESKQDSIGVSAAVTRGDLKRAGRPLRG